MEADEEDEGRAVPVVMVVSFSPLPPITDTGSPVRSSTFFERRLGLSRSSSGSISSSSSGIAYGSAEILVCAALPELVVLGFGVKDWLSILPRPMNLENGSSSSSPVAVGLCGAFFACVVAA